VGGGPPGHPAASTHDASDLIRHVRVELSVLKALVDVNLLYLSTMGLLAARQYPESMSPGPLRADATVLDLSPNDGQAPQTGRVLYLQCFFLEATSLTT
jgi:hypothetical protein